MPYSSGSTKQRAKYVANQTAVHPSGSGFSKLFFRIGLMACFIAGVSLAIPYRAEIGEAFEGGFQKVSETLDQLEGLVGFEADKERAKEKIDESLVKPLKRKFVKASEKAYQKVQGLKEEVDEEEFHIVKHSYASPDFTRDDFLTDKFDRVADVFKVPDSLYHRVGFWFDIYTKYSSKYEVLHHVDYPWIVFEVLDLREFYEGKGHKWTKYHRARKHVSREKKRIRRLLYKLSRRRSFKNLTGDLLRYKELVEQIPGKKLSWKFRNASQNLRSQLGQKDFYKKGLANSSRYLSQMEQIFAKYDLPIELTRLPLVESSFNEKAVSKVGASGIWQFMPSIGSKFMKVGSRIDERNSPLKATNAAAKLLLENFRLLKSWPLALTAYNHGPGGVKRAARKARSRDLSIMIKRYSSRTFGFASKNFYTEFLAALHAERYQQEIFGDIERKDLLLAEVIRLKAPLKAKTVARITGLTLEELKLYNQDLKERYLRKNLTLPRGYSLHLPAGRQTRISLYFDEIGAAKEIKRSRPRIKYARSERKRPRQKKSVSN